MEFKKYQHIQRLGTEEVENIVFGKCYVFYKIDGTNSSVWLNNSGELQAGSRNRCLSLDNDNAGFFAFAKDNKQLKDYLKKHPTHRLYGEWLVPHSLKTYRKSAWRKFYIFDVVKDINKNSVEYIPYDLYKPLLEEFSLNYIPPIQIVNNPSEESLYKSLSKTGDFLIEDGNGLGEGVVIKNYNYYNKYNKQIWAKIVRAEFKEKNVKTMGAPKINIKESVEIKIMENYCTSAFIEKEYCKLLNRNNGKWEPSMIPQLFGVIYHELIKEESWHFIKKYKNPIINYKILNGYIIQKIKEVKSDLFN